MKNYRVLLYNDVCVCVCVCVCVYVCVCVCVPTAHTHAHISLHMCTLEYTCTVHTIYLVKPVYKDHSRVQAIVVSIDRWSLCRGTLVLPEWPMERPTVVSIDRWSFYTRGLRTGFTVYVYVVMSCGGNLSTEECTSSVNHCTQHRSRVWWESVN